MKHTKTSKLYPLYFPTHHYCCDCQCFKVTSAMQVLSDSYWNRQRYFCPACATAIGFPPSEYLLKQLQEMQKTPATPERKQLKKKIAIKCRKK